MKNKKQIGLDFVIDRLTNSIENTVTGDSFQTEVSLFTIEDSKLCVKKNGWNFDWKIELKDNKKEVYKLTILNNTSVIQGLVSLSYEHSIGGKIGNCSSRLRNVMVLRSLTVIRPSKHGYPLGTIVRKSILFSFK